MSTGLAIYTLIHVLISLVGIFTGLVVMRGMLKSERLDRWTNVFLATTVATSVTGFGFPFDPHHLLPSHKVGILSLVILAFVLYARYKRSMEGNWRWVYVIGAAIALYLNSFVGVVQAFLKIPALKTLAPTQSEPPFAFAQGLLLLLFLVWTFFAARRFHPTA